MGFSYKPEDASNAWDAGDYDAEIASVEETISQRTKADMLKIGIRAYHPDGREQMLFDYITAAAVFKLKQIAQAVGMGKQFDAGTLDHFALKGKRISVTLEIEKSDEYGDRNKVKKYVGTKTTATPMGDAIRERSKSRAAPVSAAISEESQFTADDIPF